MSPVLLVIAGPNGAGKTTVTTRLRSERWSDGVEYLNPDDVARDRFGDWKNSVDDREAQLCARTRTGELRKIYGPLPEWVADAIEGLPRSDDFVDLRA